MSAAAIIAIAVGVVVVLGALELRHARPSLGRAWRRRARRARRGERDRAAREAQPQEAVAAAPTRADGRGTGRDRPLRHRRWHRSRRRPSPRGSPPDAEALGVSRRQFFNRATVALTSAGIGGFFAAGFVAFLWPTATGGFGQQVTVGKLDDILDTIRSGRRLLLRALPPAPGSPSTRPTPCRTAQAVYSRQHRRRHGAGPRRPLPEVPAPRLPRARRAPSSQWFECPCHGSQYNRVGEKKAGPAPRGMDRFPVTVAGNGDVTVDTGTIVDRSADRHQHHRPGGRGPALHHRRAR